MRGKKGIRGRVFFFCLLSTYRRNLRDGIRDSDRDRDREEEGGLLLFFWFIFGGFHRLDKGVTWVLGSFLPPTLSYLTDLEVLTLLYVLEEYMRDTA